jgi:hypothetical protein
MLLTNESKPFKPQVQGTIAIQSLSMNVAHAEDMSACFRGNSAANDKAASFI